MKLRRAVRKALESGSTMYAKVEEVNLGLATVRLGGIGARMTNLSTVGGEVQKNDTVIVDWSAGINPIVRPLFLEEEEELPLGESAPESTLEYDDFGCLVGSEFVYDWNIGVYENTPNLVRNGMFDWAYYYEWNEVWDAGNMVNTPYPYGDEFITIPRDGKYYFVYNGAVSMGNNTYGWDNYNDVDLNNEQTYYRIRILQNMTPIAEATGLWGCGYWGETSMRATALEYCEAGDQIYLEYFWRSNYSKALRFGNWGSDDYSLGKSCIYIPGT